MGKKIFISYKYADDQVKNLVQGENSTVRDYVDEFEKKVDSSDDIFKGESDGEDLSDLSDDTIWESLKDRIYDSSITIVFISPGMNETGKKDRDQWIPWEVSYSLKETSRKNKKGDSVTSHSNAMLAVVLPDEDDLYTYYLESKSCCSGGCTTHHTDRLFTIIKKNKFNRTENASKRTCDNDNTIWTGTCSYIEAMKWSNFITDYQKYVDSAVDRQDNIDEYNICKEV
ncbi:TIR domain-containing protein [Sedimentibacter acidaminivorans]|nr:TIR domain-containing protein [Sedimentibacter acidaminivorans]